MPTPTTTDDHAPTIVVRDVDGTIGTGVRPAVIAGPPPNVPTLPYRPPLSLEEADRLDDVDVVRVTERLYARDPSTGNLYVAAVPGNRLTADHYAALTGA